MTGIRLNAIPTTAVPTVEHLVPAESPDGITHALRVQQFIDLAKAQIVGNASAEYDTLLEIQTLLENDDTAFAALSALVNTKANASDVYTQAQVDAAILASHGVTSYNYTTAADSHLTNENFFGDTNVTVTATDLYITRIHNIAFVKLRILIGGFSKSFPNDDTALGYFRIGAIASSLGAFDNILEGGYMTWNAEWAGSGSDSPQRAMYGSVQKNTASVPNTLYFSESDFSNWHTTQTITKVGIYTNLALVVGDN